MNSQFLIDLLMRIIILTTNQKQKQYCFTLKTMSLMHKQAAYSPQRKELQNSTILQKLSEENQLLKKQISQMMRPTQMKLSQNQHYNLHKQIIETEKQPMENSNNSEAIYFNNLQQIQIQKSPRSFNKHQLKTTKSPTIHQQNLQNNKKNQKFINKIKNWSENENPRLKIMLIYQGKDGKLYRDREQQSKVSKDHNTHTSLQKFKKKQKEISTINQRYQNNDLGVLHQIRDYNSTINQKQFRYSSNLNYKQSQQRNSLRQSKYISPRQSPKKQRLWIQSYKQTKQNSKNSSFVKTLNKQMLSEFHHIPKQIGKEQRVNRTLRYEVYLQQ